MKTGEGIMYGQLREVPHLGLRKPQLCEDNSQNLTAPSETEHPESVSRLEQILFSHKPKGNRTETNRIKSRFKPLRPNAIPNDNSDNSNVSTGANNGRSMGRCISTPELSAKKKPLSESQQPPQTYPSLNELQPCATKLTFGNVNHAMSPSHSSASSLNNLATAFDTLQISLSKSEKSSSTIKPLNEQIVALSENQIRHHAGQVHTSTDSGYLTYEKENKPPVSTPLQQHNTPSTLSASSNTPNKNPILANLPFQKREVPCSLPAFKRPLTATKVFDTKPHQLQKPTTSSSPESAESSLNQLKSFLPSNPLCNKEDILRTKCNSGDSPSLPNTEPSLCKLPVLRVKDKRFYEIKVLGQGGFSKVYQVLDADKQQLVALKVVDLQGLDETMVQSCVKEICLLKQLKNLPHVIQLYDYEVKNVEKKLYVVMEQGETDLASIFKTESLPPWSIKHYWHKMLLAVESIHQQNIMHMDLKPANFLLVCGKLKLIDFGIAVTMQEDMTSVVKESQAGTYNFMAPEVIQAVTVERDGCWQQGVKFNTKADLWSLGCILYAMHYGHSPFQHIRSVLAKMQAIVDHKHDISFPAGPSAEAVDVMRLCLRRDPKARPTVTELLHHPYLQH